MLAPESKPPPYYNMFSWAVTLLNHPYLHHSGGQQLHTGNPGKYKNVCMIKNRPVPEKRPRPHSCTVYKSLPHPSTLLVVLHWNSHPEIHLQYPNPLLLPLLLPDDYCRGYTKNQSSPFYICNLTIFFRSYCFPTFTVSSYQLQYIMFVLLVFKNQNNNFKFEATICWSLPLHTCHQPIIGIPHGLHQSLRHVHWWCNDPPPGGSGLRQDEAAQMVDIQGI